MVCAEPTSAFLSRGRYEYRVCGACGTIQLAPLPSDEELRAAFADAFPAPGIRRDIVHPETWRRSVSPADWAVVEVLYRFAAPGPILDFQCGWGTLVSLLRDVGAADGFVPFGVELSWKMASYCMDRNLPVVHGGLSEIAAGGTRVSAIVSVGGFERLTDPGGWLRRARPVLADGGHLIVLQGSAAFLRRFGGIGPLALLSPRSPLYPPWCATVLSVAGMRAIADECGFRLLDVRKAPLIGARGPAGRLLAGLNQAGYAVAGTRWPLIPGLIYVLRKESPASLSVI